MICTYQFTPSVSPIHFVNSLVFNACVELLSRHCISSVLSGYPQCLSNCVFSRHVFFWKCFSRHSVLQIVVHILVDWYRKKIVLSLELSDLVPVQLIGWCCLCVGFICKVCMNLNVLSIIHINIYLIFQSLLFKLSTKNYVNLTVITYE